MAEPRRLTVTFSVFTDEDSSSVGARVATALDVEDMDIDYLSVARFGQPSDNDWLIGHIRAAKWDAHLVRKTGLSDDRKEIYLLNIEQHLEAALKMLSGDV
jgi:hypothetical protein